MAFYRPNSFQSGFGASAPNRSHGFDWGFGVQNNTNNVNYNNQGYNQNQNQIGGERRVSLPGKVIFDLNDIKPNDIPGDGQVAWFPASDYSCVIAKGWSSSGDRIETVRYLPEQANDGNEKKPSLEDILVGMSAKLSQMEQLLITNGFTLPENKANEKKTNEKKGE